MDGERASEVMTRLFGKALTLGIARGKETVLASLHDGEHMWHASRGTLESMSRLLALFERRKLYAFGFDDNGGPGHGAWVLLPATEGGWR
jgi:hypothetical protein